MNKVFADLLNVCTIVYLDNILVYLDTPELHTKHVCEVLRHLRKHGLYARADKCLFDADTVEYLGYKLTYKTFHMFSTFGKMALPLKHLYSHSCSEYARL
jgi:hypothetical protein